ncbi:MAG: recombination mediator RecR [Actinobacteria bacterium]|nr:recombination mediator RecR [Actinomycetota bacterium]MCL5882825.1 recombination mediator RecR [Actinomycetota bacterium]
MFPAPVEQLITELSKLPGIGRRSAQRITFYMLRRSRDEAAALAEAIIAVKDKIHFCRQCFNFTDDDLCVFCRDARRDASTICVVEEPSDIIPIEKGGEYRGLYHVLGGALSPLDGVDPEHLRIKELIARVDAGGVTEIILATNPNTTGESTSMFLADALREKVRVTRLASGLPVGADLEYADEATVSRAMLGRREI